MPEWQASQKMWGEIFVVGVPIAEKVLRPALVYVFLVVALRVFGKRELAQLNPFDLVVLLSLSNTVQNAIIGNDNSLSGGLIGALALLALNYLVVRFLFRHRRLDEILEGAPAVLVEHGCVKQDALAKELLITFQHGAECHHRQRQLAVRRPDRRTGPAGAQLPGGALPVPSPPSRRNPGRRTTR